MPNVTRSTTLKLRSYICIKNIKMIVSTDNKILFCNLCQCAVSSTHTFLVQQLIQTVSRSQWSRGYTRHWIGGSRV